jgi:hypothetical protein
VSPYFPFRKRISQMVPNRAAIERLH